MLYRRAVLEELSWFDGSLPVVRDWEYHIRLARRRPIRVLDGDALAFWHQRIGVHGDRGNSVIAMHDDHRRTDKLVRDRALRAYAAKEGIGPLLYAARMFDDKAGALHVHLEGVEQQNREILARLSALDHRVSQMTILAHLHRYWSHAQAKVHRRHRS